MTRASGSFVFAVVSVGILAIVLVSCWFLGIQGDALAFLGSLIGAAATIIAVRLTISYERGLRIEEEREGVLPFIAMSIVNGFGDSVDYPLMTEIMLDSNDEVSYRPKALSTLDSPNEFYFTLHLESAGNGPAINVSARLEGEDISVRHIGGAPTHSPVQQLLVGATSSIVLYFQSKDAALKKSLVFVLKYSDIHGRTYEQRHELMRPAENGLIHQFDLKFEPVLINGPLPEDGGSTHMSRCEGLYEFIPRDESSGFLFGMSDLLGISLAALFSFSIGVVVVAVNLLEPTFVGSQCPFLIAPFFSSLGGGSIPVLLHICYLASSPAVLRVAVPASDGIVAARRWGTVCVFMFQLALVPVLATMLIVPFAAGCVSWDPFEDCWQNQGFVYTVAFLCGVAGSFVSNCLVVRLLSGPRNSKHYL